MLDRSKQSLPKMSEVLRPLTLFMKDKSGYIRTESAERLNTSSFCKTSSEYDAYGSVIDEDIDAKGSEISGEQRDPKPIQSRA